MINQQGGGLSDIIGAGGLNIANLLSGAGGAASAGQSNLAQLLANLSTGQGTNLGNLALQGGQTGAQAALAQGANQQQLIGNLLGAAAFGGAFDQGTPPPSTNSAISAQTLGRGANLGSNFFGGPG